MKIATARSKTSRKWRTIDLTWEQFVDQLRTPMRTAETAREYKSMGKDERDRAKEAAGGFVGGAINGGQRKTEFIRERWLITLDADHAKPGAWETAQCMLDWAMACYSTHSHTAEKPRLRWILPTDRAMTPDEYPAVARMVASWLDIETMDPTTYELARLFYWPTSSKDGEYEFHVQAGPVLRVDEVLARYGPGDAWKDASLWPIAKAEQEVRQRAAQKAGEPTEKPGLVGMFCRVYDVEDAIAQFLPDVYTETSVPGRYTYAAGSTAGGAVVYDGGKFLFSNHATDPAGGASVNAFDLVRIHKYGQLDGDCGEDTPVTRLPSYTAMCKWAAELPEIKAQAAQERADAVSADFADLVAQNDGASDAPEDDGPDWKAKLTLDEKTGEIEETLHNATLLLRNLPDFKGKLGYNPMSDAITIDGELPWWSREKKRGLEDVLDTGDPDQAKSAAGEGKAPLRMFGEGDYPNLYSYFEHLGFHTRQKTNGLLDNALQIVAREHTFHPITSYLKSLTWDGLERLDTMFIRWLGAEDDALNREITRLWMIAAVDRVMRPGCQFDSVLITCGPQGIGKTRMLRMLARGYFTSSIDKLDMGKGTAEKLQGIWIVELGELDAMRRGDVTGIKNFLTATSDTYRVAYARASTDHPRQCIFAGTSNEAAFLRDSTGERRFWIMPVSGTGDQGELRGFREEVDQLWAEAFQAWTDRMRSRRSPGQPWAEVDLGLYLSDPQMKAAMDLRQASRKLDEEDRDLVESYLDTPRPANWYDLDVTERRNFFTDLWLGDRDNCELLIDRVSVREVRCELFGEREEDAGRKNSRSYRITDILNTTPGWRPAGKQRTKGYRGVARSWVRIGGQSDQELK